MIFSYGVAFFDEDLPHFTFDFRDDVGLRIGFNRRSPGIGCVDIAADGCSGFNRNRRASKQIKFLIIEKSQGD